MTATSVGIDGMVHSPSRRIDRPLRRKQVASLHDMIVDQEKDDLAIFSEHMRSLHRKSTKSFPSIDMTEKITTVCIKNEAKPEQSLDQDLRKKTSPIFPKLFFPFFIHKQTRKR